MFRALFRQQLAEYISSEIVVVTSNSFYEGILLVIGADFIELAETVPGYEGTVRNTFIPIETISYVRVAVPQP